MALKYLLFIAVFTLQSPVPIQCDNILFLGLPYFSHFYPMTFMAKELHKRGHNSYFSVPQKLTKTLKQSEGVNFIPMKDDPNAPVLPKIAIDISFGGNRTWGEYRLTLQTLCDNLLLDEDWFRSLESVNASLAVVDGVFLSSCLTIVPYRLSIPFLFMGAQNQPSIHRTPWAFSVFPSTISTYSEQMSFPERMKTFLFNILTYLSPFCPPSKSVKEYAPNKPEISFEKLLRQAELHIVEIDVLLDYPVPALPNVEYLGGMATHAAEPLNGDLHKFIDSSKNGIILVSFGSVISSLPKEPLDKMGEAFKQIKYDVVWRNSDTNYSSANVFLTKWMPQNDILGHSKTRLFITHCGNGGQFESLYHAVPMLGFPVFADQPHNGKRMEVKGFGISMNMLNFTVEELISNINEIIENPKYKKNIQMASNIFKSRPEHPSVRGARIVDDVIKYGGGFLRSYCQDMPLYQYFMLDILAVGLSSAIIGILIVIFILRKCLSFCCRTKEKTD